MVKFTLRGLVSTKMLLCTVFFAISQDLYSLDWILKLQLWSGIYFLRTFHDAPSSQELQLYKKRLVSHMFLSSTWLILSPGQVIDFISRLKAHNTSGSGKAINLDHAVHSVALDVLTLLIFSKPFHVLSAPEFDHPFIQHIEPTYTNIWIKKYLPDMNTPFLVAFTRFLSKFNAVANVFAAQLELVKEDLDLALQDLEVLRDGNSSPVTDDTEEFENDLTQTAATDGPLYPFFLRKVHEQMQKSMNSPNTLGRLQQLLGRNRLIGEGFNLHFAGTDTIANTCVVGIRYLLSHKDILKRVVKELDDAWPQDDDIAYEDLEKLPYLVSIVFSTWVQLDTDIPSLFTDRSNQGKSSFVSWSRHTLGKSCRSGRCYDNGRKYTDWCKQFFSNLPRLPIDNRVNYFLDNCRNIICVRSFEYETLPSTYQVQSWKVVEGVAIEDNGFNEKGIFLWCDRNQRRQVSRKLQSGTTKLHRHSVRL